MYAAKEGLAATNPQLDQFPEQRNKNGILLIHCQSKLSQANVDRIYLYSYAGDFYAFDSF